MRRTTAVAALAILWALPSFSGESSVQKAPFYRHEHHPLAQPRQSGNTVIVNAASFEPGISPGDLATIFGEDLTTVTGVVLAQTNPLPTRLAGVQVLVAGFPAPIYGIAFANGEDQISIQVPYEAPTGPQAAEIQVYDEGSLVADFFTDSFVEDPGIFTYNGSFAVAQASDFSLIGPNNPAIPGEALILYTTGLGPLDLNLADGFGSPTTPPFAETVDPFQVILNGENCSVFFSGLAPGFVGLYQINFYVPQDAPPGNLQLFIQSPFVSSAFAVLPVQ